MNFSCGCIFDRKVKEPHFKKSKYFEDLSASFAINAKNEQLGAHYSWLVQMHKVPANVQHPYIEATFENPTDPKDPIIVPAVQLKSEQDHFQYPRYYFISPALGALDCKLYNIKLTAYSDKSKTKLIAEHENQILSRINSESCVKSEFMEKMRAATKQAEWETRQ
ncbi:uncharacterized protein BX663DRAFT_550486 [Cokeromyces recurvatus]|uniref:uncharacterized protein n=1 Tax=Cokeromyces recurvatus TaxID=90255 RepID=UPI00221EC141|nr:uncharacterized protein BX663DRAFT_550486 [Cokeromyces recurvatus]KAI7904859.1 hypothetical protein BX663DRAFT_550486 [Cokeromyces recurvatus]